MLWKEYVHILKPFAKFLDINISIIVFVKSFKNMDSIILKAAVIFGA